MLAVGPAPRPHFLRSRRPRGDEPTAGGPARSDQRPIVRCLASSNGDSSAHNGRAEQHSGCASLGFRLRGGRPFTSVVKWLPSWALATQYRWVNGRRTPARQPKSATSSRNQGERLRRGQHHGARRAPPGLGLLGLGLLGAACPVAILPQAVDPFALPKQLLLIVAVPLLIATTKTSISDELDRNFAVAACAVLGAELLAFAGAPNRLGAILGNAGYRFGLTTQLCLLLVAVVSATTVTSTAHLHHVLRISATALVPLVAYAVIQTFGYDPFTWNVDSSQRVFSTIGNPNDLAGYCVLAIAFAGLPLSSGNKHRYLSVAALLAILAGTVVLTRSRSGAAAFVVSISVLGICTFLNGWTSEERKKCLLMLAAVCSLVATGSVAGGVAGSLSERFSGILSTSPTAPDSLRTRWDIWRGAFSVAEHYPITGVGQDGLIMQFNQYRPADLGAPFSQLSPTGSDPLVSSPHAVGLEVFVSLGSIGFLAAGSLVAVVALAAWRCLRTNSTFDLPFVLSGLSGFAVMASFNPLSLAPCVLAAVLAGSLVGLKGLDGPAVRLPALRRPALSYVGVGMAGCAVLFATIHCWADHEAYAAIRAASAGRWPQSESYATRAAALMPFEANYRREQVVSLLNRASTTSDLALVARTEKMQVTFLDDFPGLASDYITLARIRLLLGSQGVDVAMAAAKARSPNGPNTASDLAALQAQVDASSR